MLLNEVPSPGMSISILKQLQQALTPLIDNMESPIAAFDADGTLWPSDVGREFFYYQVKRKLLRDPHPSQIFHSIRQKQSRKAALQWLAKAQARTSLSLMEAQVNDFLTQAPPKPFSFQKHLIEWLLKHQVSIFVVSSSLKWVLDKALIKASYPVPFSNIIGVETKIINNKITDELIEPAPIEADKPLALKKLVGNMNLLFAAGNTLSDKELLESALVKLTVASALEGSKNYASEQELLTLAKKNKWFYLEDPTSASNSSTSFGTS